MKQSIETKAIPFGVSNAVDYLEGERKSWREKLRLAEELVELRTKEIEELTKRLEMEKQQVVFFRRGLERLSGQTKLDASQKKVA